MGQTQNDLSGIVRKLPSGFPTRLGTNLAVLPLRMARGLKFQLDEETLSYVAKIKALISRTVTAWLICTFVSSYAKSRFSHDVAHLQLSDFLGFVISHNILRWCKRFVPLICILVYLVDKFIFHRVSGLTGSPS